MAGGGFFESKAFKTTMRFVYGWGAAVVIIGAMFKLLHLPGAALMLGIGLSVEALIFFLSVFEVPHEDPDWSLVYPELAGMEGHGDHGKPATGSSNGAVHSSSVTQELDHVMEVAGKIDNELIESLGKGLKTFGDRVATISQVSDIAMSTSNLSGKIDVATKNVEEFSDGFSKASSSLVEIANSTTNARSYGEQMDIMTKNVASLNAIYELELQDSNNHLKALNKFYGTVTETMKTFGDSLQDAQQYKEEVSKLAKNLSALNNVYGNMLSAMNYTNKG